MSKSERVCPSATPNYGQAIATATPTAAAHLQQLSQDIIKGYGWGVGIGWGDRESRGRSYRGWNTLSGNRVEECLIVRF